MNELRFETCSADDSCLWKVSLMKKNNVESIPLVYFETPDLKNRVLVSKDTSGIDFTDCVSHIILFKDQESSAEPVPKS